MSGRKTAISTGNLDWFAWERRVLEQGLGPVCGIDEAGRGPLAGWALEDAHRMPPLGMSVDTVINGAAQCASIAAASILAKVSRDRLLEEWDRLYPEYGFAKHKGYGTKAHYDAILRHGVLPIHRKSFLKNLGEKQP